MQAQRIAGRSGAGRNVVQRIVILLTIFAKKTKSDASKRLSRRSTDLSDLHVSIEGFSVYVS